MRKFLLIGIRRCKMRGADVVTSSQGAPEADITPELGNWEPRYGRAAKQNAANFSLCADAEVVTLEITDQFVELNKAETATPNKKNIEVYRELQLLQDETSKALPGVFGEHRKFVL